MLIKFSRISFIVRLGRISELHWGKIQEAILGWKMTDPALKSNVTFYFFSGLPNNYA